MYLHEIQFLQSERDDKEQFSSTPVPERIEFFSSFYVEHESGEWKIFFNPK